MVKLQINGERLDLPSDTAVRLTMQGFDFFELKDQQSNFSNTFNVPLTLNNKKILEHSDTVNADTNIPYKKNDAILNIDGIEFYGHAIINGCEDDYEITFFSGNKEFFDEIEGKSIRSLDLSDFDHTFNFSNIYASQSNANGYIYPIIDFGVGDCVMSNVNRDVDVRYLHPFFYVSSILERIFVEAEFSVQGDILTDERYLSEAVSILNNDGGDPTNFLSWAKTVKDIVMTGSIIKRQPLGLSSIGQTYIPELPDNVFDPNDLIRKTKATYEDSARYGYHIPFDSAYTFKFMAFFFMNARPAGSAYIKFVKYNNGTVTTLRSLPFPYVGTSWELTYTGDFTRGEKVYCIISVDPELNPDFEFILKSGSWMRCTNVDIDSVEYGSTWPIACNLPDISQKDFLKALAHRYGLIFFTDKYSKTVTLRSFSDIYKNKIRALDWSNRIDSYMSIEYEIGDYAQINFFKYKKDENVREGYGDGYLYVNDKKLEGEKTIIEQPFAASENSTKLENRTLVNIKVWTLEDGTPERTITPEDRIVYLKEVTETEDIIFKDNSTSLAIRNVVYADFINEDQDYRLGFANNLLDNYENIQSSLFVRPKKLTIKTLLKASDIINLDFFVPVFIRKFREYFYINKIDYQSGTLSDVELIRL